MDTKGIVRVAGGNAVSNAAPINVRIARGLVRQKRSVLGRFSATILRGYASHAEVSMMIRLCAWLVGTALGNQVVSPVARLFLPHAALLASALVVCKGGCGARALLIHDASIAWLPAMLWKRCLAHTVKLALGASMCAVVADAMGMLFALLVLSASGASTMA